MAALVAGIVGGVVSTPDTASAIASSALPPAASPDCSGDNFAPASRTVSPTGIVKTSGTLSPASPTNLPVTLASNPSYVVLDFGREVGGPLTLTFGAVGADAQVQVAFSESIDYTALNVNGTWTSDSSAGGGTLDGAPTLTPTTGSSWTTPLKLVRGGFRYVTVINTSAASVNLVAVSVDINFDPDRSVLNDYPNSFCSSDPELNKIWYAGAYTVQSDLIPSNTGRNWGPPLSLWTNDAQLDSFDRPVLVDGAKRDRTIWPGDMGVSLPSEFASLGNVTGAMNSLSDMYAEQSSSGELPYAGPPVNITTGSATYSLWAVIGTAEAYTYSGDKTWLQSVWPGFQRALAHATSEIDSNGLANVPDNDGNDWGAWTAGPNGENIETTALTYEALLQGVQLATSLGDTSAPVATWLADAQTLKTSAIALWDSAAGEFRASTTSGVYPEVGNSLAAWFGLATPAESTQITAALKSQWNAYGAGTPERWNSDATFPGSLELQGLLAAGDATDAETLMDRQWGYMLSSSHGNGSTFWESMSTSGLPDYTSGDGTPSGAYTSLAHGWATGPTSALTFYVLGVRPSGASGGYLIAPEPGSLTSAKGNLTTPSGSIAQSWTNTGDLFSDTYSAPAATVSSVVVPVSGSPATSFVTVNGAQVWAAGKTVGGSSYQPSYDASAGTLTLTGMPASATVLVGAQLQAAPSVSPTPNAAGWINTSSATVTWNWSDSSSFTSSASNCPASTKVSAPFNGTVSASCTDSAGQSVTATQLVKVDNSAPTSAPDLRPRPASSGWSGGAVTVDWNWTDVGSGIAVASCPRTSNVSTPGVSTVTVSCTDVAGNTASASQVVKIDTGIPSATSSQLPPANGNGWTQPDASGNVTLNWKWTDSGGSGLTASTASNCPPATVVNQTSRMVSPGVHTVTVDCNNTVGRQGHATATVRIDGDPPADRPQVVPGQSGGWVSTPGPVSVRWQWTDGVSGTDTTNGDCPTSTPVVGSGTQTVTSTCRDLAGNTASDTITLHVDQTPPASNPTVSGGVVQWHWIDPESGLGSSCTTSSALPVGGGTAIASCSNNAGRYAIATYKNTDTGSISGTITEATTGKPIGGACIAVTTATSSALQACADANGNYAVTGIAGGSYNLSVSDPSGGHMSSSQSVVVTTGVNAKVSVALVPVGTGNITGTIIDTSGNPAPDVCLYLVGYTDAQDAALPQIETCTDANGNYDFANVPAGTYRGFLTNQGSPVLRYGYPMFTNAGHNANGGSGDLVVPNGNQTLSGINATMQPFVYGTLTGRVTDNAGTPLGGVHVNIYSAGYPQLLYTTTTNPDGSYTIQLPDNWANYDVQFLDPSGTHQPNQVGNFTVVGKQINTLNATLGSS